MQVIDIRLAVLGNVDTGKSTLLGVLAHGELDNGRGRARLNLFRHLHEIQSGRTSSISHEILGFNSKGEVKVIIHCNSRNCWIPRGGGGRECLNIFYEGGGGERDQILYFISRNILNF